VPAVPFLLGVVIVAGVMLWRWWPEPASPPLRIPELSAEALAGKAPFDRYCGRCHGENGAGTTVGPPLVHRTYRPALHGDVAFELAVRRGVRAHHWRFGDMPPQRTVSQAEVVQITRYVRELQRANGIE